VTGWHPVTVFFPREEARPLLLRIHFFAPAFRFLPSLCLFPYCEFLFASDADRNRSEFFC
jgi:hypothetical protein